jgi:membrane associated rhomboid family serine protease
LAGAVVTVETERIKGSNPWCLWWWFCIVNRFQDAGHLIYIWVWFNIRIRNGVVGVAARLRVGRSGRWFPTCARYIFFLSFSKLSDRRLRPT